MNRSFDATGALTDIASTAFSLHVKRDAMGNVVALGDSAGVPTPTEIYGYDSLHRLTSLTAASAANDEAYTYNQTGDRLSKTRPGQLTGEYTYKTGTHHLVGVGANTRQVDARGNTTASVLASGAYGFGYNQRNRLTVVQNGGATVGAYVLNAFGQRVQKTAGSTTTFFDYDEDSQILGEQTGSSQRDYVWLDDLPVGIVDIPAPVAFASSRSLPRPAAFPVSIYTYAIHADALGTPRVITNVNGVVQWQWIYATNPFGEKVATSPSGFVFNLRLPGQYFDAESGLNYNVNRDYDPATGRYIQSDPIGLRGGVSTYEYVESSPLLRTDTEGLQDEPQTSLLGPPVMAPGLTNPGIPGAGPVPGRTPPPSSLGPVVGFCGSNAIAGAACVIVGCLLPTSTADSCSDEPRPPPGTCPPRGSREDDDRCYAQCAHLLPSPTGDLQSSEYRKCYRECKGTL